MLRPDDYTVLDAGYWVRRPALGAPMITVVVRLTRPGWATPGTVRVELRVGDARGPSIERAPMVNLAASGAVLDGVRDLLPDATRALTRVERELRGSRFGLSTFGVTTGGSTRSASTVFGSGLPTWEVRGAQGRALAGPRPHAGEHNGALIAALAPFERRLARIFPAGSPLSPRG